MTSKSDKLREVVEYAIEKGWHSNPFPIKRFKTWEQGVTIFYNCTFGEIAVETLIFDHDFAKAVFGEQLCCYSCGQTEEQASGHCSYCDFVDHPYWFPIWKYHLKQAVISEDPIDYYHKFIKSHE